MGPSASFDSSSGWYSDLIQWIRNNGGYIHESLGLFSSAGQVEEEKPEESCSKSSDNCSSNNSSSRGITASQEIPQGTVLIRLPMKLAISGETFPSTYRTNGQEQEERNASPWLRCVISLMSLYLKGNSKCHHHEEEWKSYLNSLPDEYDSILLESSWSDQDIDMFLSGTTIGNIAKKDRLSNALYERFDLMVKPYMIATNIIDKQLPQTRKNQKDGNDDDDEHLFTLFQKACACISTRAFHLGRTNGSTEDNKEEKEKDSYDSDYTGPFLLPFIDLLNHTSCPHEKCTTLQRTTVSMSSCTATKRDASCSSSSHPGYFSMVAERNIQKGEEILHSYGQNLTSGQLFQTFGFVEESLIRRAAAKPTMMQDANNDKIASWAQQYDWTPAILSKQDILEACQYIASSKIPKELEYNLGTVPGLLECDFDWWNLPSKQSLKARNEEDVVQKIIPEDILISFHEPLSCDVVTLCCIQFLPDEAHEEIFAEECMLSPDIILQDYFLGSLVLKAILHAIEFKALQYKNMDRLLASIHDSNTHDDDKIDDSSHNKTRVLWNRLHQDKLLLNHFLQEPQQQPPNLQQLLPQPQQYNHAMYGLTLRIEEMTCIYQLEQQCQQGLESFQQQYMHHSNDDDDDDILPPPPPPCKKFKLDSC